MSGSTTYQDSFGRARPNLAYQAINRRLSLARALTTDLAAYYEERAIAEEAYVKALQKLSGRLHNSGNATVLRAVEDLGLEQRDEARQLGAWHTVMDKLEQEITDTAKTHETWRKKVLEEVEGPLRSSLAGSSWSRWQQGDAQLASTVKEYDSTLDKVQKGQSKASKSSKATSSKLISSQSQLATLGSSLTSSLPAYLAQSQALDESHSAFLKEALVRAGTFSSDLGRERMEAGERLLVNVLGVDEQVEMQTWALRESMRAGGQSSSNGALASVNEFGANSSIREDSIAEEPAQSSLRAPVPERQRVPSISRTAAPPPPAAPLPLPVPSTTPSKSGGGFKSLFKRDRSSSNAGSTKYGNLDVPSNGAFNSNLNLSSPSRQNDRPSMDSRDSESVHQPEDAFGSSVAQPSFDRQNSGSSSLMGGRGGGMQAPIQPSRGASGSSNSSKKRDSLMPFAAGGLFRRQSKIMPDTMEGSSSRERSDSDGGLAQPTIQESEAPAGVDEEGYSLPPAGYDRDIGSTPAGNSNLMDEDEDEAGDMPSALSSKLPAVALAPAAITESETDRQAALDRVKSTLLSSSSAPATNLARRQTRGRRDVRMTTYNPTIPDDVPLAQVMQQQQQQRSRESLGDPLSSSTFSTLASPTASTFVPERANSMLSTVSHGTTRTATGGPDPFQHATTPGLRATITETVNVLSKGGEVNRVMVTGEIALSHRIDPSSSAGRDGLRIRIARFQEFEKAAPNSAYISPIADSPGEYTILPSLHSSGHTSTVLKYQLHIAEGTEASYVPLNVKALWQCQEGQTRVIINYSTNAQARIADKAEASPFGGDEDEEMAPDLEELSFAVPVSAPVTTFQAKPAAVWAAEKARLTFNLEPLAVRAGVEGKVLAAVSTEGTAVAQPVAVRWKVVGRSVSRVGVEVVGEAAEQVEEVRRSTVSGKYLVAP